MDVPGLVSRGAQGVPTVPNTGASGEAYPEGLTGQGGTAGRGMEGGYCCSAGFQPKENQTFLSKVSRNPASHSPVAKETSWQCLAQF